MEPEQQIQMSSFCQKTKEMTTSLSEALQIDVHSFSFELHQKSRVGKNKKGYEHRLCIGNAATSSRENVSFS